MYFNSPLARKTIIGVALIAGLALGVFSVGHAIASTLTDQNEEIVLVYETNENGQTYGSNAQCASLDAEPDLIRAEGVDGTVGYVLNKDLNGDMPKTPEEALAKQKKVPKVRIIPLYDVDGKTIIGEFKTGGQARPLYQNDR